MVSQEVTEMSAQEIKAIYARSSASLIDEVALLEKKLIELKDSIQKVATPFNVKISQLETERSSATQDLDEQYRQVYQRRDLLDKASITVRKEELMRFWNTRLPNDFKGFKEWLKYGDTPFENKTGYGEEIKRLPKVKGLTFLGINDCHDEKFYIAIKGEKLFAHLRIEVPQYRGDNTSAYAKINGKDVAFESGNFGDLIPVRTWFTALKAAVEKGD
jgi:hypothetical protein